FVKKNNLQNKVNFHGNLERTRLRDLVNCSDIFILPSYKETFGISYIEAISQGIPIIYTRNEGIDGFFEEGEVGYSTDPDDIYEMKSHVYEILDNYNTISKECIAVSRMFSWSQIINDYIKIYKQN